MNFFSDSAYKEILENSETYNTRLCIERRLRMPFLDPQTGVAQNHSKLFMKSRQRMPGLREGQIYSYPAARWRKSRRQYLIQRPFRMVVLKEPELEHEFNQNADSSSIGAADTDSKDSQNVKEDVKQDWYYDEMDIHEMDGFEDQDPQDSDFDYEEPYSIRKTKHKKKGGGGGGGGETRRSKATTNPDRNTETPVKKSSSRRGRKTAKMLEEGNTPVHSGSSSKKSRMSHSMQIHDDHSNSSFIMQMDSQHNSQSNSPQHHSGGHSRGPFPHGDHSSGAATPDHHSQGGSSHGPGAPSVMHSESGPTELLSTRKGGEKGKVAPSPYCDFCLGDARENKKTGAPEELVSCSDCGRSGHPTCLQFTANMMVSVKRYRWQCIECKFCSICGTSDNDDQLLFCDDCDRGYHMYCLSPALTAPPEGSWSCKLCIEEFHTPKNPNLATSKPSQSLAASNSIISQQLQQPPQLPFVTTNTSTPIPTTIINNPMMHPPGGVPPPHPLMPHGHPGPHPHPHMMGGPPPQHGMPPHPGMPHHPGMIPHPHGPPHPGHPHGGPPAPPSTHSSQMPPQHH